MLKFTNYREKKRRSWSTDEKLQILREGDLNGMTETMRRHNLSSSTYYKWKAELLDKGDSKSATHTSMADAIEKAELEEEIARLRKGGSRSSGGPKYQE